MRVIVYKFEILIAEVVNLLDRWIEKHLRQATWLTRELLLDLLEVISVDMHISKAVDELAWL